MWTRLIPAHAGKTRRRPRATASRTAHPRSRGENPSASLPGSGMGGSSPLTRGKHVIRTWYRGAMRLIPAHAGKTYCQDCPAHSWPAHPRSRGENRSVLSSPIGRMGSSPLTRGKRNSCQFLSLKVGLIPAHAGKPPRPQDRRRWSAAHPRSRGENHRVEPRLPSAHGSSPLTRGKPERRLHRAERRRLIPAHAGKTRP